MSFSIPIPSVTARKATQSVLSRNSVIRIFGASRRMYGTMISASAPPHAFATAMPHTLRPKLSAALQKPPMPHARRMALSHIPPTSQMKHSPGRCTPRLLPLWVTTGVSRRMYGTMITASAPPHAFATTMPHTLRPRLSAALQKPPMPHARRMALSLIPQTSQMKHSPDRCITRLLPLWVTTGASRHMYGMMITASALPHAFVTAMPHTWKRKRSMP